MEDTDSTSPRYNCAADRYTTGALHDDPMQTTQRHYNAILNATAPDLHIPGDAGQTGSGDTTRPCAWVHDMYKPNNDHNGTVYASIPTSNTRPTTTNNNARRLLTPRPDPMTDEEDRREPTAGAPPHKQPRLPTRSRIT